MPAFAEVSDVEALLGPLTSVERRQVRLHLDLVSDAMRGVMGQTITVGSSTVELSGTWDRVLRLPERPVTAVTSVTVNGVELLEGTGWTLTPRGLRRGTVAQWGEYTGTPGAVGGTVPNWGGPDTTIGVDYTHGYTVVPGDLKAVCLGSMERRLSTPAGVRSETLEDYQVTYMSEAAMAGPVSFTDDDRRILGRYQA